MERRIRYKDNRFFKLYHLCYYFSKGDEQRYDRRMILDFKRGDEAAVCHLVASAVRLMEQNKMDDDLVIVRALSSDEVVWKSDAHRPLDRLGNSLATMYDCSYYPKILRKTKVIRAVKSFGLNGRTAELDGAYVLDDDLNLNYRPVLILDDVVTTGITACSIIKAILDVFPGAKINVFALAWTPTVRQQAYLLANDRTSNLLNEPESTYGSKNKSWVDDDFEAGLTHISVSSE